MISVRVVWTNKFRQLRRTISLPVALHYNYGHNSYLLLSFFVLFCFGLVSCTFGNFFVSYCRLVRIIASDHTTILLIVDLMQIYMCIVNCNPLTTHHLGSVSTLNPIFVKRAFKAFWILTDHHHSFACGIAHLIPRFLLTRMH